MFVTGRTKSVYSFKNICQNCSNEIEFPLIGDFSYGELIFQTDDGQEFYVAQIVDNPTFHFVSEYLKSYRKLIQKDVSIYKVLAIVANKTKGKEFTIDYPTCPICKSSQKNYNDNIKAGISELHFVEWNEFERLTEEEKMETVRESVETILSMEQP